MAYSPLSILFFSVSFLVFFTSSPSSSLPFPHLPPISAGSPPQESPKALAISLLAPILSSLGFQELAMAVPSPPSPALSSAWSGPVTLFAPSDDSIRSCGPSCSSIRLLKEHLVPGLFSQIYLSKLSFGTKLETAYPGRCLTITSTVGSNTGSNSTVKIFVDGVEITRPDLFNDGKIVIHGLQGFVAPLSSFSCNLDHSPPSFVPEIAGSGGDHSGSNAIVRMMLRDAIVRLRDGGYSILALAMRIKYPELAGLQNMTVFALDDPSIFAGGHAYVTEVRFHVVPNRLLMHADLLKLPEGTVLPTLVHGQHLVVSQSGGSGPLGSGLRINYVPIKGPDAVFNTKIAVHSLFFPFPHLYLADLAFSGTAGTAEGGIFDNPAIRPGFEGKSACGVSANPDECKMAPTVAPAASATVDLDDDGL